MPNKLPFLEWCGVVCGPYRTADEPELKARWERGWLPQTAIEDLQQAKLFHQRRRNQRPFWEAWQSPRHPRKERLRATNRLDMQCRIAKVILAEVEALQRHRMEPADMLWLKDLRASCRATLRKKADLLRDRKAARKALDAGAAL